MKAQVIISSMKQYLLAIALTLVVFVGKSQDDLDDLLGGLEEKKVEYVTGAFKSTRLINLHTIEKVGKNTLDFRISHRFGSLDGGAYQLFGLDQATIRIALEYGLTDWLMVGLGRSTYEKTIDGFLKANIIRQSKGKRVMPFSMSYFASTAVNTLKWQVPDRANYFSSRLAYVHQLLIASKINKTVSVQLSPTVIHKNLVSTIDDENTSYAVGALSRIKLSSRTTFNVEYIYRVPPKVKSASYSNYYNSLSVGFDIETGGHVFSLHLSNSLPMIEKGFITETNKSWLERGVHIGFNISREFVLKKH
jgi:hypothetical protein